MGPSDDFSGSAGADPGWSWSDLTLRGPRDRGLSQLDFELAFFGGILERDPFYIEVVRRQAANFAKKGELNRAVALDRRLTRLQPDKPIPWYNLACSYSLLGMIEPGLKALQKAIELGYPEIDRVLRDPDLVALRRDSRFARVIRRSE
jgi:tetratricopeptide (TPR) repeat protein